MNAPSDSCERRQFDRHPETQWLAQPAERAIAEEEPGRLNGALPASTRQLLGSDQAEQTGTDRDLSPLWELEKSGDEGVRPQAAITRRRL